MVIFTVKIAVRSNLPAGQNYNRNVPRSNAPQQQAIPRGKTPTVPVQYQQGVRNNFTQKR